MEAQVSSVLHLPSNRLRIRIVVHCNIEWSLDVRDFDPSWPTFPCWFRRIGMRPRGKSASLTILLLCTSLSVQSNCLFHTVRLISFVFVEWGCVPVVCVKFPESVFIWLKVSFCIFYVFCYMILLLLFWKLLEPNRRFALKTDSDFVTVFSVRQAQWVCCTQPHCHRLGAPHKHLVY